MGTVGKGPDAGRGVISCPGGRGFRAGAVRDRPRRPGVGSSRGGSRGTVLLRGCLPTARPRYHAIHIAVRRPCGLAHARIARCNSGTPADRRARPPQTSKLQPAGGVGDEIPSLHAGKTVLRSRASGPNRTRFGLARTPRMLCDKGGAIASTGAASPASSPPAFVRLARSQMTSVVQAQPRRIPVSIAGKGRRHA